MTVGMVMLVSQFVHHFGPDWNSSTTTYWKVITFYTCIQGPRRMTRVSSEECHRNTEFFNFFGETAQVDLTGLLQGARKLRDKVRNKWDICKMIEK